MEVLFWVVCACAYLLVGFLVGSVMAQIGERSSEQENYAMGQLVWPVMGVVAVVFVAARGLSLVCNGLYRRTAVARVLVGYSLAAAIRARIARRKELATALRKAEEEKKSKDVRDYYRLLDEKHALWRRATEYRRRMWHYRGLLDKAKERAHRKRLLYEYKCQQLASPYTLEDLADLRQDSLRPSRNGAYARRYKEAKAALLGPTKGKLP